MSSYVEKCLIVYIVLQNSHVFLGFAVCLTNKREPSVITFVLVKVEDVKMALN